MSDRRLEVVLAARDKTQKAVSSFNRRINVLTKSVFSLQSALGVTVGVGGMAYFINRSIAAADAVGKTADKLGLATDTLQEYRYAAGRAGVNTRTLDLGIQRFTRRLAEAQAGTGEMLPILEEYGIALDDANGNMRSSEAVLSDMADVIANTKTEQEALRIAFKMFDSEGAALVNMLRGGSEQFDAMRDRAHDLGQVLDEDLIRNSEKARDAMTDLTGTIRAEGIRVVAEFAPEIKAAADYLIEYREEIDATIESMVKMTKTNLPVFLTNVSDATGGIVSIYNSLPDGVVGATGTGILTRILTGSSSVGALAGGLMLLNSQLKAFGLNIGGVKDSYDDLNNAMANIWDVITGKRDWNTGALKNQPSSAIGKDMAAIAAEIGTSAAGRASSAAAEKTPFKSARFSKPADTTSAFSLLDIEMHRLTQEDMLTNPKWWDTAPVETWASGAISAMERYEAAATDAAQNMDNAFTSAFSNLEDAMTAWVRTGKVSFSDMIDSMIADIIRLTVRQSITGPLASAASGWLSGMFGGGRASTAQALAWAPWNSTGYDSGGWITEPVVGVGASGRRYTFAENNPEYVVNPVRGQMGGHVEINIHNAPPVESQQTTRTAGGGTRTDVVFDRAVASLVNGNTQTAQALSARGLKRQPNTM